MPRKKNNRKKIQEAKRKEAANAEPKRKPQTTGTIALINPSNATLLAALAKKLINP